MKTPKRIAYCSCGCALNLESGDYMDDKGKFHKCTTLFCPKCGAEYRGEAFAARCIRKNRETQLKRKLARLIKLGRELEWEAAYWHSQALCAADIADRFRAAAENAGACGQDIEGS